MTAATEAQKGGMQKILDVVERVGNKVPHPVVIFLILIAIVIVLSHVFYLLGVAITYQVINPGNPQARDGRRPQRAAC